MGRQVSAVEVNKFNAGLVTDASPLTSPDNSCLDMSNVILNIDGSFNRRLGIDLEVGSQNISTPYLGTNTIGMSSYQWDNVGGIPDKTFSVVQFGNRIDIFNLDNDVLSSSVLYSNVFPTDLANNNFSYTVVDGILVIATGSKLIYSIVYENNNTFTLSNFKLLVRDFFGVEDVFGGVDITRGTDVQDRPTGITNPHIYNLRNQSWGIPRLAGNAETLSDPIGYFFGITGTNYPANSDTVIEALYPDTEDADSRTVDRFVAGDLVKNPLGSGRAAQGYYIIDALNRGVSRLAVDTANIARYPSLSAYTVTSLPTDETPSGATCLAEFAGRVWYSGFPGNVINGDRFSPKMSSYILFSKVVDSPADISLCYQEGDPTSKTNPDIIDTDGGLIRINEAYGIRRLVNLGNSLIIVATNGVWRVVGGDNGFTATSYSVEKISDKGATSSESVVQVDSTLVFWGDDAIYHVTADQFGGWVADNISYGHIQRFFDAISIDSKSHCKGIYDRYEKKIRWVFENGLLDTTPTRELVLDMQLKAFYPNTIDTITGTNYPKMAMPFLARPYEINEGENISRREVGYVVVVNTSPSISYSFGYYSNQDFRDWFSVNSVGIDADAYVITSYMSGSDFQREKQLPYITTHFRRTETGWTSDGIAIGQSGCLIQARWDWSDSDRSGKWGREFQAYRYRRLYIPQNLPDNYDNGFSTVTTRNKVRGNGKVLSLRFSSEPYRNLHLYGWSMVFSVSENV